MIYIVNRKPWLSNDVINNIFGHGREERRLLNIVNKVATSAIEERKQKLVKLLIFTLKRKKKHNIKHKYII